MEAKRLEVFERIVIREVDPHGQVTNFPLEPGEHTLVQVPNPLNGGHMDWLVLEGEKDRKIGATIGWWQDRIREGEVEIDDM